MSTTQPRSAIVTGGGGGIGRVISARLATAGYSVVVADADRESAERVAATLPAAAEQRHIAVAGDLTRRETNAAAVEAALSLGGLCVVVNGVGISPKADGRKRPFFDIDEDEWDLVLAVNLKAPLLLSQEAFRHMPGDGSASILNILSITSTWGTGGLPDDPFPPYLPSSAAYAASKAALQNLTGSLARELSSFNIRVNGVAPGFVATPMTGGMPSEETLRMIDQIPMGRFGEADEIADAVEFLVGNTARYINGASLAINGGALTC